jgi:hypothetical protein
MASKKKKTIVLRYENNIPIILCELDPSTHFLKFYCEQCHTTHCFDQGEGIKKPHCFVDDSEYIKTGHILELSKEDRKKIT